MEFSLHRHLKQLYSSERARQEVTLGDYRIDVVRDDCLVEIQVGSLAAIRDKVGRLVQDHRVLVVKPLVGTRQIVRLDRAGGRVVGRRLSPKRGTMVDLIHELVYFTRVFPHPNLTLEVPLVDIEEWRHPGHGRRRRWRANDFEVEDQRLVRVRSTLRLHTARDLVGLIPDLESWSSATPLDSECLARRAGIPRWVAQRVLYVLRKTGGATEIGKRGNTLQYQLASTETARPRAKPTVRRETFPVARQESPSSVTPSRRSKRAGTPTPS